MNTLQKNILVVIILLALNFTAKAQAPGDPGGDPGAAPINDFISLMLVAAIGLAYFIIQKRKMKEV